MFEENVDEQLIQLQTGPRSDAVRAYKRPTIKSHALQISNILQPPLPKKAAKLPEEVFGGYHAENKENSVPAQNFQSNSQQSSVMHSNVMLFTNSYDSSPTFVFNFGKKYLHSCKCTYMAFSDCSSWLYVNCDSIMVVGFQLQRITDLSSTAPQRNTHALW